MRNFAVVLFLAGAVVLAGCGDDVGPADAGRRSDGSVGDARMDGAPADVTTDASYPPCGDGGACRNDSHCVMGVCVPFAPRETDPTCTRHLVPGPVRPAVQCVWEHPPTGDPTPTYTSIEHTPLVVNLGITPDADTPARPSVVFIADGTYSEGAPRGCTSAGTLRVIDGATCHEQGSATAMEDRVNGPVTPAAGDLDGDGFPEIVAAASAGGLIAFKWDRAMNRLVRFWRSTVAGGGADDAGATQCQWGAITLADLDDDGRPEIFFEGYVWGPDGVRLSAVPGYTRHGTGMANAIADVDNDNVPELISGDGTWQWDRATRAFVLESYWVGPGHAGSFAAIADLGDFAGMPGDAPGRPEVVVVNGGRVWVQTIAGAPLFASPMMGLTGGGPPTIADFDGDGHPEIGVAFGESYVVFDTPSGAVLWSRQSKDASSAQTGSSVFDFNGDGRAEVVYADECYARIYDGRTGDVLFSQPRFSSTWQENPVVADVDGDSAAEVVVPTSSACRTDAYCTQFTMPGGAMFTSEFDPIFPGLRCTDETDCPGGACVMGLCRCSGDGQCGDTYRCADPIAGTPGAGRVCRSTHRDCPGGVRIYRDARDRWAGSRPIWNQHAYHVTNVQDDGRVPRTSMAQRNWATMGLNNFRQNVQGGTGDLPGSDLTVGGLQAVCEGANTRLRAQVCNRGRVPLDRGIVVVFRQAGGGGDGGADGGTGELCRLLTSDPIGPGVCTAVECLAPVPARGRFEATADPDDTLLECHEENNLADGDANCIG